MPRRSFLILLLFSCLALLSAPRCLLAQSEPVTVTARASLTAFTDEDVRLEIIIRGSQQAEKPVVPRSEDYTEVGSGFMINSSNGGSMMAHTFQLRPKHAGVMVVPPISVTVAGKPYTTNEVRITVYERPPSELAFSIIPEKTRIYVGEPIRLRLALRLASTQFRNPRFVLGSGANFDLQPHPDQPPPSQGAAGQFPFSEPSVAVLDGREVSFASTREVIDGVPGDYLIIDQVLIAQAPGRIEFGRAHANIGVPGRQVGRDFFGRPQYALEERVVAAKPVTIDVLPLPTQDRPADFYGLVGSYSLSASIDQREVSVGEPVNLLVTISGPPPISLVPSLDLASQRELAKSFRVPRDPVLPTASNATTAMFQQMIRARRADVAFVPSIGISYFDTTSGTYKLARSQPIALKVKPSADAGLGDDVQDDASESDPAAPSASVMSGPFSFNNDRFDLGRELRNPAWLSLLIAPPLALAAVAAGRSFLRRRRALEPVLRRRRAVRMARRELDRLRAAAHDTQASALGAGRALTNLAADWFGHPRHTLTSLEACRLLAAESSPAAESLAPVLAECDRVQFGSDAHKVAAGDTLVEQARAALLNAETQLREGKR